MELKQRPRRHFVPDTDEQLVDLKVFLNPARPDANTPKDPGTTWTGEGFNVIWRPLHDPAGPPAHFLDLARTSETLRFTRIPGNIMNRGLFNADIEMFGLGYLDQISDVNDVDDQGNMKPLHFEPGVWVYVPPTQQPAEGTTYFRMASIPHGTTVLVQGVSAVFRGAPSIRPTDIVPFRETEPSVMFPKTTPGFQQADLSFDANPPDQPATRTHDLTGITQAMLDNPNSLLADALKGHTVLNGTVFMLRTTGAVSPGGGLANTAFLAGRPSKSAPVDANANANAVYVSAAFYVMDVKDDATNKVEKWLQYTQRVILNHNEIAFPHVTVASLKMMP